MARRRRLSLFLVLLGASIAGFGQTPQRVSAQTAPAGTVKKPSSPVIPKTPWGHPDLQGVWDFSTVTPFERASGLGEFFDDETWAKRVADEQRRSRDDPADRPHTSGVGAGPEHWYERGLPSRRTSMVIDPPDGRVPPLTPDAQKREAALEHDRREHEFDSYEHRDTYERCFARPIPRTPTSYNNAAQIIQTPGHVVIHYESMHDARIVPLDGRSHLSSDFRLWNGDSRGRWEGNTLVVDTTNFSDKQDFRGNPLYWARAGRLLPQGGLHLVERFRMVDANTIEYEVTIDDPTTWTRPWTITFPWARNDRYLVLEYACHEGNYSIVNIFSGARVKERTAKDQKKSIK